MVEKVDHIGIAVRSIEEQKKFYGSFLALDYIGIEEIADQKVRVAMYRVGDIRIELLEPTTEDSPVAKFIEKRGEGIHHIAYCVRDIDKALQQATSYRIKLIDGQPRRGAGGQDIAFLHPHSTAGVLTELCQSEW